MSDHADTIREALDAYQAIVNSGQSEPLPLSAIPALDALLAENQRLRDALAFYAEYATYEEGSTPHPTRFAEGIIPIREDTGTRARAALAAVRVEDER